MKIERDIFEGLCLLCFDSLTQGGGWKEDPNPYIDSPQVLIFGKVLSSIPASVTSVTFRESRLMHIITD